MEWVECVRINLRTWAVRELKDPEKITCALAWMFSLW